MLVDQCSPAHHRRIRHQLYVSPINPQSKSTLLIERRYAEQQGPEAPANKKSRTEPSDPGSSVDQATETALPIRLAGDASTTDFPDLKMPSMDRDDDEQYEVSDEE